MPTPPTPDDDGLDFKPVTTGLGFQPFADGMPYAPEKKANPKPLTPPTLSDSPAPPQATPATVVTVAPVTVPPTGATVAGRPEFVFPETVMGSKPVAQVGFGYLLKRSAAFILDSLINSALCLASLSLVLLNLEIPPRQLFLSEMVIVLSAFLAVFNWSMITAQEVAFKTSLGKRAFRLSLEGSPFAIFARALLFPISIGLCGIGLIFAIFHNRKLCLHDSLTGIHPEEIARL